MSRRGRGLVVFLAVLAVLAGCSIGKNVEPESGVEEPLTVEELPIVEEALVVEEIAVEEWPSVTRLEDGREGFVIREKPSTGEEEWLDDFEQAVERMREQDYAKAIELLEKVIKQSPGVTAPYLNLAICLERTGKHGQAEQHLKTAMALIPDHPAASSEYGLLLRKTGRFAEARAVYEQALATFPEYLPLRRNLGILCDLYLNDPACALAQYEIYSEAKPEDEPVKIWLAELRLRLGR